MIDQVRRAYRKEIRSLADLRKHDPEYRPTLLRVLHHGYRLRYSSDRIARDIKDVR